MPSYWDEDLAILSAENVNFSVETAGLGSRFAAATIDLTLQGLVLCLVGLGGPLLEARRSHRKPATPRDG